MDIYQQLNRVLTRINLSENESRMITAAFICPGLSPQLLGKQCGFKRMTTYRILEALIHKGYLETAVDPNTKFRTIHPVSLKELSKRVEGKGKDLQKFALELQDIGNVLQRTSRGTSEISIHRYYDDEAKEAFMDMHFLKWEMNYAIGDFDAYCPNEKHFEFEMDWVRRRANQGRKAIMAGHHIGNFTREVVRNNERDLRTAVFSEQSIKDYFIMAFPEVDITFIGSTEKETGRWTMLKVESKDIAKLYTQMTQNFYHEKV